MLFVDMKKDIIMEQWLGYVAFGPYDTTTGAPTNLVNTTVEAKRTPSSITKSSNDENKVVEIGRTVTYSVLLLFHILHQQS